MLQCFLSHGDPRALATVGARVSELFVPFDVFRRGALRAKPGPRPSPHRSARLSSLLRLACLFFVFVCSSFLLWWVPTGRSFALGSSHRLRFPNQLTCPPVKPAGSAGDGGGGSPVSSSLRSEGTGLVTKAVILSTYPPTKCGLATFAFQLRQGLLQARNHHGSEAHRSSRPTPHVHAAEPSPLHELVTGRAERSIPLRRLACTKSMSWPSWLKKTRPSCSTPR